jgi:hypothetical protein
MAEEKTPAQDLVDGLFGDPPAEPVTPLETPPAVPPIAPPATPPETPPLNEDSIVTKVVAQLKPMLANTEGSIYRQQALTAWYNSPDGQMFVPYKEFIDKAARDPRFAGLDVAQLPAAILKPAAYNKLLMDAKEAADKAAKDGKMGGGSSARPADDNEPPIDYKNMPRDEFKKTVDANRAAGRR